MKRVLVFHRTHLLFNKSKTRLRSNDEHSPSSVRSSQRSTTTTTHQHQ
ncbi:unnamed protein product, partial [Rotaria magnacalcarata]